MVRSFRVRLSFRLIEIKMFQFYQSTGKFMRREYAPPINTVCFEGEGYSGHGEGRNNPEMETVHDLGPIPRGLWRIGDPVNHPRMGPLTFPLIPIGHDAHGRTGFFIHGNNAANDASHGCPILDHEIREHVIAPNLWTEEDRRLIVL